MNVLNLLAHILQCVLIVSLQRFEKGVSSTFELSEKSRQPVDSFPDTFLRRTTLARLVSEIFFRRFITAPFLHSELRNRLSILWGAGAAENRHVFFFLFEPKSHRSVQPVHLQPSKAGRSIQRQTQELGKNVSVFLIVCNDIPGLFFTSFPHFWLVHLAVITSIVTNTPVCYMPIKTTDAGMSA